MVLLYSQFRFSFVTTAVKSGESRRPSVYLKLSPHLAVPNHGAATAAGRPGPYAVLNATPSSHRAEEELADLPAGLRRELMPRHVAVIMDGNRRWARTKGLPTHMGYEAGLRAMRRAVELCSKWGIQVLTVFAFSSDNWVRPKVETDFLMGLFERGLRDEIQYLMSAGVRISLIGDSSKLLKSLRVIITKAMESTAKNTRLHLIIAVNYSGQNDIVQACQKLAVKVKDGLIKPEDINRLSVERELETNCTDLPSPDLLIRTSGELRISNFLLWQLAYTELHFVHSYWPDFGEDELREALFSFQKRQRRYGGRK